MYGWYDIKPKQWPLAGEFVEFEYSPKWSFWKIGQTRYIRQPVLAGLDTFADIRQSVLVGLDTFADIRQPSLLGLARLAKAKFCKYYANLASLASLANLASVG
jgi:hypothetical protein